MIVEFAGLPKSGKSSSIGIVRDYFSRSGYSVKMITKGGRTCPLSKGRRVEFACWAANQILNLTLEAKYNDARETLILQDRGLFDTLGFFKLLHLGGQITRDELTDFLGYFVHARWTRLVDLVILFEISPEMAIERDAAVKLGVRPGSITNVATMRKLSSAYDFILEQYGDRFVRIERVDTTDIELLETARRVIRIIQENMPEESRVTHKVKSIF